MKQFIILILILIFIISCTSNTIYKKPKDLISKDQMVDLIADMQIALSAKSIENKYVARNIEYMHLVYDKYGIDSTRFASSNFYYTTDIDEYNNILKRVKNRLDETLENYKGEQKRIDSLDKSKKKLLIDANSSFEMQPKKVFRDTSFVK